MLFIARNIVFGKLGVLEQGLIVSFRALPAQNLRLLTELFSLLATLGTLWPPRHKLAVTAQINLPVASIDPCDPCQRSSGTAVYTLTMILLLTHYSTIHDPFRCLLVFCIQVRKRDRAADAFLLILSVEPIMSVLHTTARLPWSRVRELLLRSPTRLAGLEYFVGFHELALRLPVLALTAVGSTIIEVIFARTSSNYMIISVRSCFYLLLDLLMGMKISVILEREVWSQGCI
jgi:hypothetical protein